MKKLVTFLIFFTVCNLYQLIINVNSANAQTVDIGVYPPVFQIQATAPTNVKVPFSIENFADTSVDLTIYLRAFTANPAQNGTISFLDDLSSFPDPSMLQRIQVEDENNNPLQTLSLAPKQTKNLSLVIDVPQNQSKGDYYVALVFNSAAQNNSGNDYSEATAGISSNILLSVGPVGPTTGEIESFSAPPFLTRGPVPFTVNVKNTSDHYITPKGDIVITNLFGQNVGKIQLLPVNLLANSERRIPDVAQKDETTKAYTNIKAVVDNNQYPVAVWPEKFLVGPYTATLTIALSDSGPLFKKTILFFAFPTEYLLAIFALILIIIFVVLRVRNKMAKS
jgi:hypothetical protein